MKKAQASLEFVLLMTFLIIIFILILTLSMNKLEESKNQLIADSVDGLSNSIEQEIKLTKSFSDGYTRIFNIPKKINDKDYEISIVKNRELVIKAGSYEHVAFLPANIIGNIGRGINLIEKKNGIVYVTGIDILLVDKLYLKKAKNSPSAALFTSEGNVIIKGELRERHDYIPTADDEFLVKGGDGKVLLAINLNNGNMFLKGIVNSQMPTIDYSELLDDALIFKDKEDNIVIKVDSQGNLYLKNGIAQKGNP